jgi:hypothetical protein
MRALWALCLFAGCGKDLHHTVDGGPPDVSFDTLSPSTGDIPAGAVVLRVTRGVDTVPNVAVFFQDPTSKLVADKLTNEGGLAWALLPDGGFVTALQHIGAGVDELTTFAGVKPSDVLALAMSDPGQHKAWPMKLTFQPDASATSYSVRTSCSDETFSVGTPQPAASDPPNTITLSGCDDGVADFSVMSYDVNGDPTGNILYAEGVALPTPPAAPVDSAAEYPQLDLAPAFGPVSAHSASYTNAPDFYGSLSVYQAVNAQRRAFDAATTIDRTGPSISGQLSQAFPTTGPSTMLTVTTGNPNVTYDADGVPHSGSLSQYLYFDWGAMTETYMLDVSTVFIGAYQSNPAYDAGTRTISWTEGSAPLAADLVRGHIHVYRDGVPSGSSWGWRILAPHAAASVTFPQLPVVGFDFTPSASDTTTIDELTTAKVPGGYDAWRAHGFTDFARAVTGASGTMSVQMLYSPPL